MEDREALVILDRLFQTYTDRTQSTIKNKLTDVQLLVFQRSWAGASYREIAEELSQYEYDYIKQVGSQLWQTLSQITGKKVSKNTLRTVLLRACQERKIVSSPLSHSSPKSETQQQDWGEAIDLPILVGRDQEIKTLKQWIEPGQCRVVLLLGMGGIGKTALAVQLAQELTTFQFVIWRSLREAPPVKHLFADLIKTLSQQQNISLPENISDQITLLIQYLSNSRCLLLLDNLEPLLQTGDRLGYFHPEYEGYAELLQRVAHANHQSCLLLTSRELPQLVNQLRLRNSGVQTLQLDGLSISAGQSIFADYGTFRGSEQEWQAVIQHYAGNPLALKIVASAIQEILNGNLTHFIAHYLQTGQLSFADIRDVLDQQFDRLSITEQAVMYWLAINREAVNDTELQADLLSSAVQRELLDALMTLRRRSLIEITSHSLITHNFTQQAVVMEYVTERLTNQITKEICEWSNTSERDLADHSLISHLLHSHAILKAQSKDYIRAAQTRLILKPIADQLLSYFGSKVVLETQLQTILHDLRMRCPLQPSYAAGNILNLLCHLQIDLAGYDFSRLAVWQAYLQETSLSAVNFAQADLSKSVFAECFGGIVSIAFSPDGKYLVIADSNGGIRLWDLQTGQIEMTWRAHESWIWSIAFSPDGKLLATASHDHTAKLWDVATGQCLRVLNPFLSPVVTVTFSPDGAWLATGSDDLMIRLWALTTTETDRSWTAHEQRIFAIVFSADGKTMASCSQDQSIKLWDVETGQCLKTLLGHTHWVQAMALSPVNQVQDDQVQDDQVQDDQVQDHRELLASGSDDHTIKLWDVKTGECLRTLTGHTDAITAIVFTNNGEYFVSSSHDCTLRLWETQTGKCLRVLQGHTNRLWSAALRPQATIEPGITGWIASGGDDHTAKLWDLRTGQCIKTLSGYTNAILTMTVHDNRTLVATGHEDETVKLWDTSRGEVIQTLQGHTDRVWSVAFAPASFEIPMLASGSGDHTIKLWNHRTGACLQTLRGHSSWVWSVKFHPHEPYLISSSYDGTLKVWSLPDGTLQQTLEGHAAGVIDTAFSPDGEWLASCGFDTTVRLWHWRSATCVRVLQEHNNPVWCVAFSPDPYNEQTSLLASAGYDFTIKIWNVQTGECLQTLVGHEAAIGTVNFIDNQYLISGSSDHTIRVWNIQTGECLQTLRQHQDIVSSVVWQDRCLLSSSFDATLKFWDWQAGECRKTLRTPRPYEGMSIANATGLTEAQRMTLKALGAIETAIPSKPATQLGSLSGRSNKPHLRRVL